MPATFRTACDLKFWRQISIPLSKLHVKVRYEFFLWSPVQDRTIECNRISYYNLVQVFKPLLNNVDYQLTRMRLL